MKVLITGGGGYIARNLTLLFQRVGHEVLAPTRLELDMTDDRGVMTYFMRNNPDLVIHCANRGGRRGYKDTYDDFVTNIKMFENSYIFAQGAPVILIGSGAEFDRRFCIKERPETEVFKSWPIDFYGLAKNLITRRALTEHKNIWVLRLFGCFNHADKQTHFIPAGILNTNQGLPIEVHRDIKMDFFYMDDVFTVINQIIVDRTTPRHINLVYKWKINLIGIATLIQKYMGCHNTKIKVNDIRIGNDYTGDGTVLDSLKLPLVGLDEGIKRTIYNLT